MYNDTRGVGEEYHVDNYFQLEGNFENEASRKSNTLEVRMLCHLKA
jgi:hypothetical protein